MQLIEEPISQGDTEKLIRWLNDPAYIVFQRVVESSAFKHEVQACDRLMKGTDSGDKVAENDALAAIQERHVLVLMRRLRAEKSFMTCKAVPTITSKL